MPNLVSPTGKPIALKPVRANAGIEAAYRKRLTALIDDMHQSMLYWLSAAYKRTQPVAMDESAAEAMRRAMADMAKQWQRNFNKGAQKLADWFTEKNRDYTDRALQQILKDAGFTVRFGVTPMMSNMLDAAVAENVSLIKSIASQHLTQVESMVMQSVSVGRDLGTLAKGLQKQFGVTKRRAALISRDQNQKATAAITKTRQLGLGITQAKWQHSTAGNEPRPSHVAASGKTYDVDKGMYLDGVWTWPGREINCRCVSIPVIPGFID